MTKNVICNYFGDFATILVSKVVANDTFHCIKQVTKWGFSSNHNTYSIEHLSFVKNDKKLWVH